VLFTIFIVYSTTVVIRGLEFDANSIKKMLLNIVLGILPYFTPLVLLFPRNIGVYKKVFSALIVFWRVVFIFRFVFFSSNARP
jgi:hypothetical protein